MFNCSLLVIRNMAKTIKKKQQEPELQKKAKHEQKMLKLGKNEKSLQKKTNQKHIWNSIELEKHQSTQKTFRKFKAKRISSSRVLITRRARESSVLAWIWISKKNFKVKRRTSRETSIFARTHHSIKSFRNRRERNTLRHRCEHNSDTRAAKRARVSTLEKNMYVLKW